MTSITFSFEMDAGLKDDFENVCESLGIDTDTAISMFAEAAIRDQNILFDIKNRNQ